VLVLPLGDRTLDCTVATATALAPNPVLLFGQSPFAAGAYAVVPFGMVGSSPSTTSSPVSATGTAPVTTTGWVNPRRSSLEGEQGAILSEITDNLEQYLSGDLYADSLVMGGHKVELRWNGTEMRLLIDGVDKGKVALS
jgi:hypothetical protein